MGCKYCDWFDVEYEYLIDTRTKLSIKSDKYPGINAYIGSDGTLYIESVADTYEPSYLECDVEINFCPMCGCNLKENKEKYKNGM